MLPPSKSEYDQDDAAEHDLEAQMRAAQSDGPDQNDDLSVSPGDELDPDADAGLETDEGEDDLGQEEVKPKKKGMGKGTIIAAVGAGLLVAMCGAAYVMQGQMQSPAPVSKKIAVDPSLLESKPAASLPAEPSVPAVVTPPAGLTPPPPVSGTEITPNLSAPSSTAPTVSTPSGVSSISAPPSDPFGGSTTAPVAPPMPSATPMPTPSATPTPTPSAPVVSTPSTSAVAITPVPSVDGPRADPFGAVTPEKAAPKVEKPAAIEKAPKPAPEAVVKTEKPAKPAKVVKARPAAVDSDGAEVVKPRAVKPRAKKPTVIRQDMTVSEPHPSQERVQPQSSESFHGYEKLF